MTREERDDAINYFKNKLKNEVYGAKYSKLAIEALEQEPQSFKWCTDCKEYDQEKHCCHRYSKVIRDTVAEMKQEQESVLDKLRADIKAYTDSQGFINISEYRFNGIIDKYKAEMRVDNGNNNH